MTNILQVLLGLALVNYLMFDVFAVQSKPAVQAAQMQQALVLAGTTTVVFIPTVLLCTLLEQWVLFRFMSSVIATVVFVVILAAILHVVALIMVKRNLLTEPTLSVFLPLVFATCVVMGLTLPIRETGINLPEILLASLLRCAGFAVVLITFAQLRQRLAGADISVALRGTPTTLLTAALLSLTFMGFAGLA